MKQKFSDSIDLHVFFLAKLKNIVGNKAIVKADKGIFTYNIIPNNAKKCLWQEDLEHLFKFCTKYGLYFYIDFDFSYLRVYTYDIDQKKLGNL